jgi:hypothetical protein
VFRVPATKVAARIEQLRTPLASRQPSRLTATYASVAEARSDIISEIQIAGSNSRNDALVVTIIGYRLGSVGRVLDQLTDLTRKGISPLINVHFRVYHVDPGFMAAIPPPQGFAPEQVRDYREKLLVEVATLRSTLNSLARDFDSPEIATRGVSLQLVGYKAYPAECAYIIGADTMFLGSFMWDPASGDFGRPKAPCYLIRREDHPFSAFIDWSLSRAELFSTADAA